MTFSFNVGGLTPQDAQNQGGGGGNTVVEKLSPKNIAGLCFWLDGEINSREGVRNTAVNGMENLMYSPYVGYESSTGCGEVLNGIPTFKDKSVTLGGTCFYPNYNMDDMTIELVFQENNNTVPHSITRLISCAYNGGFQVWFNNTGTFSFQAFNSSYGEAKVIYLPDMDFKAAKNYITISTKLKQADSTNIYLNGEKVNISFTDDAAANMSSGYNMGIGGMRSSNTASTEFNPSNQTAYGSFASANVDFSLVRIWSRQLPVEEIKQNYNNSKRRFG